MASTDDHQELILRPERYLETQSKNLSERINEIRLDPEAEAKIAADTGSKIIRDKLLGSFKLGQVVHALLTWNENIDKEIRSAKRDVLLAGYFERSDKNEAAIDQLKNLLTDAQGNTLFNKILRLLDDSPPDFELASHLSAALSYIANSKFRELFEQHRYALSQIEQLTPQALTVLADHGYWPSMQLEGYSSTGGKVDSDWLNPFAKNYTISKGINDQFLVKRVEHSISDLINGRFIEARLSGAFGQSDARCSLTDVGQLIVQYLESKPPSDS
jgi:hypothetical protein